MPKIPAIIGALWFCLWLGATGALAQNEAENVQRPVSLSAQASHLAGPGQSENDLRKICYLKANQALQDKAAQYLAGFSQAAGLSREELTALAAGLLRPQVSREQYYDKENAHGLSLTLSADFAPLNLGEKIAWFAQNAELRGEIVKAQREITAKTAQIAALAASDNQARQRAFSELAKIQSAQERLTSKLRDVSKAAREFVRKGLSENEVRRMLGEPAQVKQGQTGQYLCLNYGPTWVVLGEGKVECLRKNLEYKKYYHSDCHCAGDVNSFIEPD